MEKFCVEFARILEGKSRDSYGCLHSEIKFLKLAFVWTMVEISVPEVLYNFVEQDKIVESPENSLI